MIFDIIDKATGQIYRQNLALHDLERNVSDVWAFYRCRKGLIIVSKHIDAQDSNEDAVTAFNQLKMFEE